jgi:pimeloyl-ACP methyl ester carboxylesterase
MIPNEVDPAHPPMSTRPGLVALLLAVLLAWVSATSPATFRLELRGKPQILRLYGTRGAFPVIVTSGDGGWIHLGPHVADVLAANGCSVIGFDAKAYLSSFTSGTITLDPRQEPDDYRRLIEFAAGGSGQKPVLVGVSEGAGLSVLAAADPQTRGRISGVIGLGLPEEIELGWRWTDSIIYVTKGTPREPTFRVSAMIGRLAPVPLAEIHATGDEFVPLQEVRALMDRAREPKRQWIVEASNHRFSDNRAAFDRRLLEALAWVRSQAAPR